ncbi:hypothetical protein BGZ82_011124, partial [Podila clonocystis]
RLTVSHNLQDNNSRELFDILTEKCRGSLLYLALPVNIYLDTRIIALLQNNRSCLQELIFNGSDCDEPFRYTSQDAPPAAEILRLRVLHLKGGWICIDRVVHHILPKYPLLESLTLTGHIFHGISMGSSNIPPLLTLPPFQTLKRLSLSSIDDKSLTSLLTHFPGLEHLSFQVSKLSSEDMKALRVLSAAWPKLRSLEWIATHHSQRLLLQRRSSSGSTPPQHHQQLWSATVRYPNRTILIALADNLGQTLEHIVIEEIYNDNSKKGLLHILARCPRLKTLKLQPGLPVDVRYIIAWPWVCTELEALEVPFELDPNCFPDSDLAQLGQDEKDRFAPGEDEVFQAERLFMHRLAALTKLKRLGTLTAEQPSISESQEDDKNNDDLRWSLNRGLDQLSDLFDLQEVVIGSQLHLRGLDELAWMKAHWPSLVKLVLYKVENSADEAANAAVQHQWLREHWPELKVVTHAATRVP